MSQATREVSPTQFNPWLNTDFSVKNASPEQVELFERIKSWDLSKEKEYLANRFGYSNKEYLDQMEIEYKKYLFLICSYHDLNIPITDKVDDLWHAHILHTRRYSEFCKHVFGRQIFHNPTASDEENIALRPDYERNTLPLYEKHFGTPKAEFWLDITPAGTCCTH